MNITDNSQNKNNIPFWLLNSEECQKQKKHQGNNGFIRKTLSGVSKIVTNDLFSERNAQKKGLLQNITPEVKLLTILAFLVISGFAKGIVTLVTLTIISSMMVMLSKLDFISFIKRVWPVFPLIMLILSLPASTNLFIIGKPILYIYKASNISLWFITLPHELYISMDGIKVVIKLSLRLGVSFSFGYILATTTHWSQTTKSLRALYIPKIIVSILDMTYRYIFVLCKVTIEIYEARLLRTVGIIKSRQNRQFVSGSIAALYIKSNAIGEEIYNSMLCRGYTGDPVYLDKSKFSGKDMIWIFNVLLIIIILFMEEALIV